MARLEKTAFCFAVIFALAVVGLSLYLEPAPDGVGTHTQLGLKPCHKLAETGWPCLTCGMTTAFAHAARFHLLDAIACQPFGALLFASIICAGAGAAYCLFAGRPVLHHLAAVHPTKFFAAALVVFVLVMASWTFKAREPLTQLFQTGIRLAARSR